MSVIRCLAQLLWENRDCRPACDLAPVKRDDEGRCDLGADLPRTLSVSAVMKSLRHLVHSRQTGVFLDSDAGMPLGIRFAS